MGVAPYGVGFPYTSISFLAMNIRILPLLSLLLLLGAHSAPLAAQQRLSMRPKSSEPAPAEAGTALERGNYAVVIDLDRHELSFRRGKTVFWTATIGSGTGERLQGEGEEWEFSTPRGVFSVQAKEQDPAWYRPDWYYIENKLPVPPKDDPKRWEPGGLGAAAIYLAPDLAIHGTDTPELLGQRISHGCIRLSNRDALRLYHNVQIGTEVIIRGVERGPAVSRNVRLAAAARARPAPPEGAQWKKTSTPELLALLEDELTVAEYSSEPSRWPEIAGVVLRRGLDGDGVALRGLLELAEPIESREVADEYATFLADAYASGTVRTLTALARLPRRARERAAEAIVQASLGLYHGTPDDPSTPWPTRRVPRTSLSGVARTGWDVLQEVERERRG